MRTATRALTGDSVASLNAIISVNSRRKSSKEPFMTESVIVTSMNDSVITVRCDLSKTGTSDNRQSLQHVACVLVKGCWQEAASLVHINRFARYV